MKQRIPHVGSVAFPSGQLNEILKDLSPRSVKKNTILLKEGVVCTQLYFIVKGCARTYFTHEDGTEKTSSIILDNNFITAWTSFISQSPSVEYIEIIENSELLVIDYQELSRLVRSDIKWKEFYLKLLEIALLNQSRKIEALMTLDAKHRYLKLLNGNPKVIQNVSNKILASFLHMREETLSRLKSKK
jgi:CRP-like cAMP-binding protein